MKYLKCFNRFFTFLFTVMFMAATSLPTYVKADNNENPILGWKDDSNNDAVISVEMWGGNQLPKYTGPDMERTSTATFHTGHATYFTIFLKDGYELDKLDDNAVLYLYGVQTGDIVVSSDSQGYINTSQLGSDDFAQNQEFYIYFKTKKMIP